MVRKKATEKFSEGLSSFERELVSKVDKATFARMVMKAGLPTSDARKLCEAFTALQE